MFLSLLFLCVVGRGALAALSGHSFCEIKNQGNVLTAGLRGGEKCNITELSSGLANVPTDACPSTSGSVRGIDENYKQTGYLAEEFGRQSFEYLEFLDSQAEPPVWYEPLRFEGLKPPTSAYKPIEYNFGCIGADQTACLDGNLIRYLSRDFIRNFYIFYSIICMWCLIIPAPIIIHCFAM